MTLQIDQITPGLGAEIRGVNLAQPLLPDQIENKEEFKQNIEEEEFKEVIVPEVVAEQEPDEETLKKISEMQQLKV